MKIAKFLVFFTIIIIVLFLGVFGMIRLVNSGVISLGFSDGNGATENSGSNITLPDLLGKSISGELIVLNKSVSGSKILEYKLSTGRQKLITDLGNIKIDNPDEDIAVGGDEIYLLGLKEGKLVIVRIDNKPNSELEILLEQVTDKNNLGLKVIDGEVYFTSYSYNALDAVYEYELVKLVEKEDEDGYELTTVATGSFAELPLLGEFATKDNLYFETYSLDYQQYLNTCLDQGGQEASCLELSVQEELYTTTIPEIFGYPAGQNAKIAMTNKDEVKTVLEGSLNKFFTSLYEFKGDIYCISGDLESFEQPEDENSMSYFTEFEPVYLEKFDPKKLARTELATLPASSSVKIADVEKNFVVLEVVQSGKTFLWMYNVDDGTIEKINDIECAIVSGCDNFLIAIN